MKKGYSLILTMCIMILALAFSFSSLAAPSAVDTCDDVSENAILAQEETSYVASLTNRFGDTVYYTDLSEAISDVEKSEKGVLKLLDDIELTERLLIRKGNFTIDLNGKTITSTMGHINNSSIEFSGQYATMYVSVIDSSDTKGGIVSNAQAINVSYAELTLGDVSIVGKNVGVYIGLNGLLKVNGADISCIGSEESFAQNCAVTASSSSKCVINSGTLSGTRAIGMFMARTPTAEIVINGGDLRGTEYDIVTDHATYSKIDLSLYPSPEGITVYHEECPLYPYDPEYDKYAIKLPEGYSWIGTDGEEHEILDYFQKYTVQKTISSIEINLGAKADENNVRYAEIDGEQVEITEDGDVYSIPVGTKNLLVEFVEKTSPDTTEIVKSQYFYVDMTKKLAKKLDMDSYMSTDEETSVRTNNPMGIRFKSHILATAKLNEDEFVIDEYGFIVATEESLEGKELNFGFGKYVTGVAYNKAKGRDIVFESDDTKHVFTGVVKNVPVKNYKTNLVCKTYTKISVDGKQFIVYGEPATGNIYDTATKLLKNGETLDKETYDALMEIILSYENVVGTPGDDLFP